MRQIDRDISDLPSLILFYHPPLSQERHGYNPLLDLTSFSEMFSNNSIPMTERGRGQKNLSTHRLTAATTGLTNSNSAIRPFPSQLKRQRSGVKGEQNYEKTSRGKFHCSASNHLKKKMREKSFVPALFLAIFARVQAKRQIK